MTFVCGSLRQSCVNDCWLTAARNGPNSGRNEPDPAIFRVKTGHFRAKWDAQKSVNYVAAAGINDARPFAAA
jgi:hypothetical protein